ncbi:Cytochrome b6-f complex iron-sulfur subunit [Hibiscus syriacus]|uniref:plastoquinol--plastocyanin reductase n=1 Tax=Hibiscus syriacus TaxID=106335 RepID=A0A6A2XFR5_HIBSY|nr:Cytochrome b6-f complex iron-sulfur subunit [Hibiscus syriacus]
MASSTLSPAQLCSSRSGMFCPSQASLVKPTRTQMVRRDKGMNITCQATSIPADRVPDMGKRQLMNLLLLGAISLPTGFMLVPYAAFFVPPGGGGTGGGRPHLPSGGEGQNSCKLWYNAVCTHLGCVVPFNQAENKFICPCHGSQYNDQGRVVRGPAPLSLALAHTNVEDGGKVVFTPWTETDFRTGDAPWWA